MDWYEQEIADIKQLAKGGHYEEVTARDMDAFRENSKQLEQFLDGDFSSMDDELREQFPNAHRDGMTYSVIPVVPRYAHEMATLYPNGARRLFTPNQNTRRQGATPLTAEQVRKLREVYRSSDIDGVMHKAHRRCTALNMQTLAVFPAGPRKVLVLPVSQHDVQYRAGNPLTVADIATHAIVSVRVPRRSEDGEVWWTEAVFTATEAYFKRGAEQFPIYGDSIKHDFGEVPLMTIRAPGMAPPSGHYFSELPEDILRTQVSVNLADSDLGWGLKFSWPQTFIQPGTEGGITQELVDNMPTGPSISSALPGAGSTATVLNKTAPVDAYKNFIETTIRNFAIMRDMSPDAFSKANAAKTAVSRAFDKVDRQDARNAWKLVFKRAENDLVRLVGWVCSKEGILDLPHEELRVSIEWPEWEVPTDPLHAAQARALDYQSGVDSPVRYVMRRFGVGMTEAMEMVRRNLDETRQFTATGADVSGNMNRAPEQAPPLEVRDERE